MICRIGSHVGFDKFLNEFKLRLNSIYNLNEFDDHEFMSEFITRILFIQSMLDKCRKNQIVV